MCDLKKNTVNCHVWYRPCARHVFDKKSFNSDANTANIIFTIRRKLCLNISRVGVSSRGGPGMDHRHRRLVYSML